LTAQAKPGIARVVAARRASDQVQMPEKTEFRLAFRECPETSPSKGRSRQERLHTLDSEQAAPSTRPLSTPLTKVGGVTLCGAVVAKRADWEAPSATPSVAPGRRNSQGRSQVRSQLQQRLKTRAAVEPSPEQRPDRFHPLDQGRRSEPLRGSRGKARGLGGPRTSGTSATPSIARVEETAKVYPVWLKAIFQVKSLTPPFWTVASWRPRPWLGARNRGCCLAAQRPRFPQSDKFCCRTEGSRNMTLYCWP
jgi:hypothetical protein